jgi:hypothetical protein
MKHTQDSLKTLALPDSTPSAPLSAGSPTPSSATWNASASAPPLARSPQMPALSTASASGSSGEPDPAAADLHEAALRRLWRRLTAVYGHKWSSQFGGIDEEGFTVWSAGLADLGVAAIRRGFGRCLRRPDPWPPSLPEFRALCRFTPEDLGLPAVAMAFQAASQQRPDWSTLHPIIWHARQAIGAWDLIHEPLARLWPRFQNVYQSLVERALAGETFAYPPALAAPRLGWDAPAVVTAPGDARAHVQYLLARLRGGAATTPLNPTEEEPPHADPANRHPELEPNLPDDQPRTGSD